MRKHEKTQWTDEAILMALYMRDHLGRPYKEIAKAFGCTTSAMCGLLNRIDVQCRKHDSKGHKNGSMSALWWKKRKRKAA